MSLLCRPFHNSGVANGIGVSEAEDGDGVGAKIVLQVQVAVEWSYVCRLPGNIFNSGLEFRVIQSRSAVR